MKFTLTYDGPLPPSANKPKASDVWRIRKDFHPQLVDLWASHPALKSLMRKFPAGSASIIANRHHSDPKPQAASGSTPGQYFVLDAPIEKYGINFVPLVRETYALHCGLKIIFLRKELPGRVYQGGDLDGRIKTLLDALAMPQHKEQVLLPDTSAPNPIYCLMEEDAMVSSLDVQSERLLTGNDHPKDFARLVIEVDVRVREARAYNQSFLG